MKETAPMMRSPRFQEHLYHYSTRSNIASIASQKLIRAGDGQRGRGVYLTSKRPGYNSKEEIKTAVRHPNIPDTSIECYVELDATKIPEGKLIDCNQGTFFYKVDPHAEGLDITDLYVSEGEVS
ncbi:HYD1 signature containing ADP-ribosyltransferase family protein [Sorangium sp. So ce1182]|uniref:HYD1 signature containing ADP-ribosyltransferase family protein n=1 Tax=Sorangium sp. So ce1182 TaxID=3133334 RepID=UPI003F5F2FE6